MRLFPVVIFFVNAIENPCPSTECWTFDNTPGAPACTMLAGCSELQCSATALNIGFKSNLFGLVDDEKDIEFGVGSDTTNQAFPTWNSVKGQWTAECQFGQCGMTHQIIGDEIHFKVVVAQEGNKRVRRSIPNTEISAGGLTVITAPIGMSVTYICAYSTKIEAISTEFEVTDVTITGTTSTGTGNLAAGFSIAIDGSLESGQSVILGQPLHVALNWAVQHLNNLEFYTKKCTVVHGSGRIDIILGSCYSKVLGVEPLGANRTDVSFQYVTFQVQHEKSTTQSIECSLQICMDSNPCPKATDTQSCPSQGEAFYFGYTYIAPPTRSIKTDYIAEDTHSEMGWETTMGPLDTTLGPISSTVMGSAGMTMGSDYFETTAFSGTTHLQTTPPTTFSPINNQMMEDGLRFLEREPVFDESSISDHFSDYSTIEQTSTAQMDTLVEGDMPIGAPVMPETPATHSVTVTSTVEVDTDITYSDSLTDTSSMDYTIASASVQSIFHSHFEEVAENNSMTLDSITVTFSDSSTSRRRKRSASASASIVAKFSKDVDSVTAQSFFTLLAITSEIEKEVSTAATNAISTSGGTVISSSAIPSVSSSHTVSEISTDVSETVPAEPESFIPEELALNRQGDMPDYDIPTVSPESSDNTRTIDTPCPSVECWDFETSTHECILKPGCSWVSCGADRMEISFVSNLFGLNDGDTTAQFYGTGASPTWDSNLQKWTVTCKFGECGMASTIQNKLLDLKVQVAQNGNQRTRSIIPNKIISLGGFEIITAPFGIGVDYTCSYPTEFSLTSATFEVADVTISGTTTGSGDLSQGFEISVNNGDVSVIMGQAIKVSVTWAVTKMENIYFFLEDCNVKHGQSDVQIVKDSCYSEKLEVSVLEEERTNIEFSYKTFHVIGEENDQQTIMCSVHLCQKGETCGRVTDTAQCPNVGDFAFYKYSTIGFTG